MTEYPAERGPLTPEQKLEARRAQVREERPGPRSPMDRQNVAENFKPYGTRPIDVEYLGEIWTVIPTVLDDWDMVEAQANGEMENISLPAQYRAMLGEDQYQELKEVVREKHGYISARVLGGFLTTVQKKLDGGNS